MKASAGFVSASALGMACGPAVACLLQTNFKFLRITFNQDTLPGWIMALAWFLYLLCLWTTFREPPMKEIEDVLLPKSNSGMSSTLTLGLNLLFGALSLDSLFTS